jgi:hypothetical protein
VAIDDPTDKKVAELLDLKPEEGRRFLLLLKDSQLRQLVVGKPDIVS